VFFFSLLSTFCSGLEAAVAEDGTERAVLASVCLASFETGHGKVLNKTSAIEEY